MKSALAWGGGYGIEVAKQTFLKGTGEVKGS